MPSKPLRVLFGVWIRHPARRKRLLACACAIFLFLVVGYKQLYRVPSSTDPASPFFLPPVRETHISHGRHWVGARKDAPVCTSVFPAQFEAPLPTEGACLVLGSRLDLWDVYLTREYAEIQHEFLRGRHARYVQTVDMPTDEAAVEALTTVCGEQGFPDVVVFWEVLAPRWIEAGRRLRSKHGTRLLFWKNDIHRFETVLKKQDEAAMLASDLVIGPYVYLLREYFPSLNHVRRAWVPNSAQAVFVEEGGRLASSNEQPRDARILLAGAISDAYPCRQLAEKICDAAGDALCVQVEHPGNYISGNHAHAGQAFARALAKHKAAVTGGLTIRFLVSKHFEMAAVGTLFVTDEDLEPVLQALGFERGVHYLAMSCKDAQRMRATLEKVRRMAEDDDPSLRDMTQAARELTENEHTTRARGQHIYALAMREAFARRNHSTRAVSPCGATIAWPVYDHEGVAREMRRRGITALDASGKPILGI